LQPTLIIFQNKSDFVRCGNSRCDNSQLGVATTIRKLYFNLELDLFHNNLLTHIGDNEQTKCFSVRNYRQRQGVSYGGGVAGKAVGVSLGGMKGPGVRNTNTGPWAPAQKGKYNKRPQTRG